MQALMPTSALAPALRLLEPRSAASQHAPAPVAGAGAASEVKTPTNLDIVEVPGSGPAAERLLVARPLCLAVLHRLGPNHVRAQAAALDDVSVDVDVAAGTDAGGMLVSAPLAAASSLPAGPPLWTARASMHRGLACDHEDPIETRNSRPPDWIAPAGAQLGRVLTSVLLSVLASLLA